MATSFKCPWCGHKCKNEYDINLHIEVQHTEDSPFATSAQHDEKRSSKQDTAQDKDDDNDEDVIKCTRPGCGKHIHLTEIDEHLNMHESMDSPMRRSAKDNLAPEIDANLIRNKAMQASRARSSRSAKSSSNQYSILSFLAGGRPARPRPPLQQRRDRGRLGTKELGPHAFEKSMPSSVRRVLEDAARPVAENRISTSGRLTRHVYYSNETTGLIPILADLCALDDTSTTYLSHMDSKHIHRIKCDGNFCGYWNIQMLLSHVLTTTNPQRGLPTVLQIQDEIEKAWANNICAYGRTETGGVFSTRKWIGTHEALAFFQQIDIPVSASSFQNTEQTACSSLLDFVEAYFLAGLTPEFEGVDSTTVVTRLPPIYLQRAGHSLTIVGLTRHDNNERSLLIFDPSHDTTPAMSRLLTGRSVHATPHTLLKPYLWPEIRLATWDEYETLIIDGPPAAHTGNDTTKPQ